MRAPDAVAPRVYYSGPLLDGNFVVYDGKSRPEIGTQNSTVETATQKVAALKAAGVDFVKIYEIYSHTVRFIAEDMTEVSKFLEFVLNYEVGLQP